MDTFTVCGYVAFVIVIAVVVMMCRESEQIEGFMGRSCVRVDQRKCFEHYSKCIRYQNMFSCKNFVVAAAQAGIAGKNLTEKAEDIPKGLRQKILNSLSPKERWLIEQSKK